MPIQIDYSVVAHCDPDDVWLAIEDIRRWPQFDREAIESAEWVKGEPWKAGSRFRIKLHKPVPYTLLPEIVEAEKPILIHWRASGSGVSGEQWFIFKLLPSGDTEIRTLQQYSGAPLLLFGPKAKDVLEEGVHHLLGHIKREAEANSRLAHWSPPCV